MKHLWLAVLPIGASLSCATAGEVSISPGSSDAGNVDSGTFTSCPILQEPTRFDNCGFDWPSESAAREQELLNAINAERAKGGKCESQTFDPAPALVLDPHLTMPSRCFLRDTANAPAVARLNDATAFNLVAAWAHAAGFVGPIEGLSGNIAAETPEQIVEVWLKTRACPVLFSNSLNVAGIGYFADSSGSTPPRWAALVGYADPSLEPSVLIDDFEDIFGVEAGDVPDTNYPLSAKAFFAKQLREPGGRWAGHSGANSTPMLGIDQVPLTISTTLPVVTDINVWDVNPAVGDVGWLRRGIRFSVRDVLDQAGIATELRGLWDQESMDLTNLTAVSFAARGSGVVRMQFHVRYGNEWMYWGTYVTLAQQWQTYVIRPSELTAAGADDTSRISWSMVRDHVALLDFQFEQATSEFCSELSIDNVRLHGIGYDAYGFTYKE